ncbi:MAG: hypothetical protein AAB873_00515, partial [Patescibacteria group bacterium]
MDGGEKTLAGIDYIVDKDKFHSKTKTTFEGDQTVATSSALWMNASDKVERWWVDLKKEDSFPKDRTHKDILEISNLRNFIKAKIQNNTFSDPESIVINSRPTTLLSEINTDIVLNLYSGGDMYIVDSTGKKTGFDKATNQVFEEIPNSRYMEVGNT